ncbi:MAG: ABC transporter, partial [Candidatus Bathyarchaeota archaeon]|nr:ABC transporter [Candidatus Bathyarchaeota archaeon]
MGIGVVGVRARRGVRRFDEARGCYIYDVSFSSRAPVTERTLGVAEAFGLGLDERRQTLYSGFELRLAEGAVVYVTGDSGSGKSVLLRALGEDLGDRAIDIADVKPFEDRPIVETVGGTLSEALSLLSRVGLNDAYLFIRRYRELSEGQRYRFRIAKMVESGRGFWLADEFCSTLDRTTAKIVAFNIQ